MIRSLLIGSLVESLTFVDEVADGARAMDDLEPSLVELHQHVHGPAIDESDLRKVQLDGPTFLKQSPAFAFEQGNPMGEDLAFELELNDRRILG